MHNFFAWLSIGLGAGVIYASFMEWVLHRFVMHRPILGFTYPFRSHAVVHHQTFKADDTYHLVNEEDKHLIPMAWWNGPAIVSFFSIPMFFLAWWAGSWGLVVGAIIALSAYYGAYEYMHWCMHLPKSRRLEKSWLFLRLNGHHILHHRYMHKNFNVVLPLADLCLGTLMIRSKVTFQQVRGPSVPDVQPRQTQSA